MCGFIKKNKTKLFIGVVALAVLAAAFYFGGNAPGSRGWGTAKTTAAEVKTDDGVDQYGTGPIPEGKPQPVEPENAIHTGRSGLCTISITCESILREEHINWFDKEKSELLPEDGVILPATEVAFSEGESVFDVLLRTCTDNKIHLEYVNTPLYNSAYLEGIGNIYQFDCGSASGWMYSVNDWFPIYGCSRYAVQDGDVIEIVYSCELGEDVGGGLSVRGGTT